MKQTAKERHAARTAQERTKRAHYESMLKEPQRLTHSAREPAYKWTALCPVPELRMHPADRERQERMRQEWGGEADDGSRAEADT